MNEIGKKYGTLTILEETRDDKNKKAYLCKCDCGNTRITYIAYLHSGQVKNCGRNCPLRIRKDTAINEVGNKYGKLTVVKRVANKNNKVMWLCQCDCGNTVEVAGASLRNGNTKSCGCYQKEQASKNSLIDLTGQIFGLLTVLERDNSKPKGHGRQTFWKCKCECGRIVSVTTSHLRSGHTKSCGCYTLPSPILINEVGNKYGKLTVIEEYGRDKDGRVLWKCRCDCGNEKIALGKSLRAGLVKSCGCMHSKGEELISKILRENNIKFISQYSFSDLKSNKNYKLYFDFAIFKNDNLYCLIEYQGEQHFKNTGNFGKMQREETDKIKKEYCKQNNIKLIEIPYYDYDKIDWEYLKEVVFK